MYAKLKNGKLVSGELAEKFVKIGIAIECEKPETKSISKKGRPKKLG